MKKKSIILIGLLMISFIFMASATANYSQTIEKDPCGGGTQDSAITNPLFIFTQAPTPSGDGILTVSVIGDYDYTYEWIEVMVEGTSLGQWVPGQQCSCSLLTNTYPVTRNQLLQWASDGKIEVTLVQGPSVDCFCNDSWYCSPIRNIVTLDYPGTNNSLPMQQFMKILGFGNKK